MWPTVPLNVLRAASERELCYFFSIFSDCTKAQRSLTTWGRSRDEIIPDEVREDTWVTTTAARSRLWERRAWTGAVGEQRGVGWGQQCIPEYMTRCSRSDRSQPGLMKPKHFHRCFHTLGSTSSHQHRPTPPPSFHLPPPRRFDALMWSLLCSSPSTLRRGSCQERCC